MISYIVNSFRRGSWWRRVIKKAWRRTFGSLHDLRPSHCPYQETNKSRWPTLYVVWIFRPQLLAEEKTHYIPVSAYFCFVLLVNLKVAKFQVDRTEALSNAFQNVIVIVYLPMKIWWTLKDSHKNITCQNFRHFFRWPFFCAQRWRWLRAICMLWLYHPKIVDKIA